MWNDCCVGQFLFFLTHLSQFYAPQFRDDKRYYWFYNSGLDAQTGKLFVAPNSTPPPMIATLFRSFLSFQRLHPARPRACDWQWGRDILWCGDPFLNLHGYLRANLYESPMSFPSLGRRPSPHMLSLLAGNTSPMEFLCLYVISRASDCMIMTVQLYLSISRPIGQRLHLRFHSHDQLSSDRGCWYGWR